MLISVIRFTILLWEAPYRQIPGQLRVVFHNPIKELSGNLGQVQSNQSFPAITLATPTKSDNSCGL